jgi:sensor histidine kinase YesM
MPFPQRPFDTLPSQDMFSPLGMLSRWRLYSRRLFNPFTQFLLVFIISTGLKVLTQWYHGQQQLKELEKLKIQAELSFLKSQIHPHFLFNCLNSIYYMTLIKDDKAPKTVLSLSDFLRFVITESDSNSIPMEKEIGMLEEYLNLQSLRTSEKFELQFVKEGNFEEYSIMPLTFIPFVENAFKYGISAHTHCFIHIKMEMDNGMLLFTCDNSIMSTVKDRTRSSGVGLENIRKRLELAYPNRYSLVIGEDSSAFHVILQIRIV